MDDQVSNISVNRTYSVSVKHIGMASDLAQRFGVSQGAVVRAALDLLWEAVEDGAVIVDDKVNKPVVQELGTEYPGAENDGPNSTYPPAPFLKEGGDFQG